MPVKRRELLCGLGGGLAGLAFTPLPWKLLDDVSIWTQRRHALPLPPRGEASFHAASCALCPGGCALRVRCVGARPVAVAPAKHPLAGSVCPLGLTLHHLPYHPLRLSSPVRRSGTRLAPLSAEAAHAAVLAALAEARRTGRSLMVLDRRPGRVISEVWAELLSGIPNAVYATPAGDGEMLALLQAASADPARPLGLDLERARTVLSFGAPVLEGCARGRLRSARADGLRVIQVEARRSPSAALADEWVRIAPGTEGLLALALAGRIAESDADRVSVRLRQALDSLGLADLESGSGLASWRIEALAASLRAGAPAVAIGGGNPGEPLGAEVERAIALLNLALGSVGREGGIVTRRFPFAGAGQADVRRARIDTVPSGSVGLAILDAADDGRALPWAALERTLARDALVVSLSPFDFDLARRAQLLVPSAAPLERYEELLPSAVAAPARFGVSAPVLQPPPGATEAHAFITRLAGALGRPLGDDLEARLKRRTAAILEMGEGLWLSSAGTQEKPADPDAAWQLLLSGGLWVDEPRSTTVETRSLPLPRPEAVRGWASAHPGADEPRSRSFAAPGTAGATPVSPLLTLVYQGAGRVRVGEV